MPEKERERERERERAEKMGDRGSEKGTIIGREKQAETKTQR